MDISVSLSPELASFIEARVESGRSPSPNEVIREALVLLERTSQAEMETLRTLWSEGIDSGDAGEIDFAELRQAARRDLAGRGTTEWRRSVTPAPPAATSSTSGVTSPPTTRARPTAPTMVSRT